MSEYSVFFVSSREEAIHAMAPRRIVVWPVDPTWNDFGFRFHAEALFASGRAERPPLHLRLLVIPNPDEPNAAFLDQWILSIRDNNEIISATSIGRRFLSILRSESEYRKIVRWASREQISPDELLWPLRDIVLFRARLNEQAELEAFLYSTRAQHGIFRRESTFLAWHRGRRILNGMNSIDVEDAKADFSFATELPGFGGAHSLSIRYGVPAPLSDRCHALVGINGVGKSQLLRELIVALGERLDGTDIDPFTSGGRLRGSETTLLPNTFRVNRIVALSWDTKSIFPKSSRLNTSFQYLHFNMQDDELDSDELSANESSDLASSHLIQLFRESIGRIGPGIWRLRDALRPLFDVLDLAVALSPVGDMVSPEWVPLRHILASSEGHQLEIFGRFLPSYSPKKWSDRHGAVDLSSGERTFLNFGIRCAARVEKGTLLILDEPETHLHPTLISDFMRVLSTMLEESSSIALIATHSPFIVRELPSFCVHVLRLDEDKMPHMSSAFLRTYGASVDALAIDIFGDAESRQVNQDVARDIARSGLTFDQIREIYGAQISTDLLSEIREKMRIT